MGRRTRALKYNTLASLASEFVTLVAGLVLPRLILVHFGSAANGLVGSISQFLGFSAVLRAGLGGAVRAALYKPLAENDDQSLSGIMAATHRHMQKIGLILGIGLAVFSLVYPFLVLEEYDWFFSFSMALIISVGVFADNYFGVKYKVLLQADQRFYVQIGIETVGSIVSAALSVALILSGFSIQIVKAGAAVGILLSPLLLSLYVRKHYAIDWKMKSNGLSIKNRWNAFFQQLAVIVNDNVDLTLLTVLVSLKEISVYTVHFMVVNNIGKVVNSFTTGINSTFGDMIARNEEDLLRKRFFFIEWMVMAIGVVLYSVTMVMLPSFLKLYTQSVTDVNYIRPVFACLMVVATMLKTSRLPYQLLSEGAGKFKETRNGAVVEVVLNVVLSVALVLLVGIEGVLIATLVACTVRTVEYAVFCFRKLLKVSVLHLVKHYLLMALAFVSSFLLGRLAVAPEIGNYGHWALYAILSAALAVAVVLVFSLLFYRDQCKEMLRKVLKKSKR